MSSLSFTIYEQSGIAYEQSWSPLASLKPLRFGADSREPKSGKRMFVRGMGFVGSFFGEQLKGQGVYGNCGGEWVDVNYPASPTSELSKIRLAAEERWLNLGDKLRIAAHVFQLGGIYGPGRSAVDMIIEREALSGDQRRRAFRLYTSRIHVEDVCQALQASFYASSPGQNCRLGLCFFRKVYNIVDDDPAPREEVFAYAQNLIEKKWPGRITGIPKQEVSLVTVKKEGFTAEKRVSNARMTKELRVRLLHPSYRTGLKSIVDQMDNPFRHSLLDS